MGQKVHPLIFRSILYKNYKCNFYINIKKINNVFYLQYIYILYLLFNTYYKNQKYIDILYLHIDYFINKIILVLFIINKYNIIIYLKYLFIVLNYINYYYYNIYKLLCYLKIKYYNIININLLNMYIKLYYLKYKSFKLVFNYLYNNILKFNYNNIKGLKIKISGCFKNSLKKKVEIYTYGILSLNILNNNIQYINTNINTKFGLIGIKIWLNK